MNYTLLRALLQHLEAFDTLSHAQETVALDAFAEYLTYKLTEEKRASVLTDEESLNVALAEHITHLYRYAKSYTKLALDGSPLTTMDDFTYLGTILRYGSCTKSELIERNVHEKTSGMEVIKRLLKNGFLHQRPDPNDGRSKQLSVTLRGKQAFIRATTTMQQTANLVGGPLSGAEKLHLLHLLEKLQDFHRPLFTSRETDLDELTQYLEREQPAEMTKE